MSAPNGPAATKAEQGSWRSRPPNGRIHRSIPHRKTVWHQRNGVRSAVQNRVHTRSVGSVCPRQLLKTTDLGSHQQPIRVCPLRRPRFSCCTPPPCLPTYGPAPSPFRAPTSILKNRSSRRVRVAAAALAEALSQHLLQSRTLRDRPFRNRPSKRQRGRNSPQPTIPPTTRRLDDASAVSVGIALGSVS